MTQSGLQALSNPSEMFLSEKYSDSPCLAGLAVAVIMDGSRTFLIEIQVILHCFYTCLSFRLSYFNFLINNFVILWTRLNQ